MLKVEIEKFPSKPGVYLFKNKSNMVLYIGKALNLRKRVKSYHNKNLLEKTEKVDFIKTKTELESFLLEARLIKQYQPKYNVRLKDDRRYLYVGITKEKYPVIFLIRQPEKTSGLLDWFGPFPTSRSLVELLRFLRRIFPYRTCKKLPRKASPRGEPRKACLYSHLKLCPGMCVRPIRDYYFTIKNIRFFLNGQITDLISELKKKMQESAAKLQFEQAAIFKKQIQLIESLLLNFKKIAEEKGPAEQLEELRRIIVKWQGFDPLIIHRLEAFDVSNLGKKIVVGAMAVFTEGEPDKKNYRRFKVKRKFTGDTLAIKEIIFRRFNHPEWLYPQVILVDGGKPQISAAFSILKKKDLFSEIGLLGLAKKEEKIIIPYFRGKIISRWKILKYSSSSGVLRLLQAARDEAHRFGQRYYRQLHRKITFFAPG